MQQLEFFNIPSPCKRICQTNLKGLCIGCYRNRSERLKWNEFSNEEKRKILKISLQRKLIALYEHKKKLAQNENKTRYQYSFFYPIDHDEE